MFNFLRFVGVLGGVVNASLWTNGNARVSLEVSNVANSNDILRALKGPARLLARCKSSCDRSAKSWASGNAAEGCSTEEIQGKSSKQQGLDCTGQQSEGQLACRLRFGGRGCASERRVCDFRGLKRDFSVKIV